MFTKPLSDIQYSDIVDLIEVSQIQEGYTIDFKKDIHPDTARAKKELAKDLSAFANSGGGYLIIGVDNERRIVGTERTTQNRSVVEWINQVISSGVEPNLNYSDPKMIEIPDSDKILLVIEIPESLNKPHIVKDGADYYVRVNDQSKQASHYQIRDMFDYSRLKTSELNDFLNERNLFNSKSPNFGRSVNSQRLFNREFYAGDTRLDVAPIVLFSLIPKNINSDKIRSRDLREWLRSNSSGFRPFPIKNLFYTQQDEIHLKGITFTSKANQRLNSYFEVHTTGFIESGLSYSVAGKYEELNYLHLTHVIGYEAMLLNFAKHFYSNLDYNDEIILQVSFINVDRCYLSGLHKLYRMRNETEHINIHDKNFILRQVITQQSLNDETIKAIVLDHSERICQAFGLNHNYGFRDGDFDFSFEDSFQL